jgi:multidrug efflux pump subunit AcrA (membrane-fusion protein)
VAGTIHDGELIRVNVPSVGKTFTGKVSRFEDRIQSSSRTMTAEVDIDNPKHELIPGMYAEVKLNVASADNALAVPVEALEGTGDSRHLYVVDSSGALRIHKVTVGLQTPQYIQILSGAQAGEIAILGRQSEYSDGQQVRPRIDETITTPRQ